MQIHPNETLEQSIFRIWREATGWQLSPRVVEGLSRVAERFRERKDLNYAEVCEAYGETIVAGTVAAAGLAAVTDALSQSAIAKAQVARANLAGAIWNAITDGDCNLRGGAQGIIERMLPDAEAEYEAERQEAKKALTIAVETGNRAGEVIFNMVEVLKPLVGEHNLNTAKRVVTERDAALRKVEELTEQLEASKRLEQAALEAGANIRESLIVPLEIREGESPCSAATRMAGELATVRAEARRYKDERDSMERSFHLCSDDRDTKLKVEQDLRQQLRASADRLRASTDENAKIYKQGFEWSVEIDRLKEVIAQLQVAQTVLRWSTVPGPWKPSWLDLVELAFFKHDSTGGDEVEDAPGYNARRTEWQSFKKDLLQRWEAPAAPEEKKQEPVITGVGYVPPTSIGQQGYVVTRSDLHGYWELLGTEGGFTREFKGWENTREIGSNVIGTLQPVTAGSIRLLRSYGYPLSPELLRWAENSAAGLTTPALNPGK